jgi:hypothetical protein
VSGHIDLLIFIPYSFFAGKLNDFGQLIHSFLPHMVMVTPQSITSPGYFCKVSESMSLNNRDEAVLQASKGFESCAPKREWYLLSSAIWRNLARSARSWKLRAKDVGGLMLDAGADYETDLASAKGACCYPDERSAFAPGSLRCRRSKSHGVSG